MAVNILFGVSVARAAEVIVLPVANDAVNLSVVAKRHESKNPILQVKVFGANENELELSVTALSRRAPYRWLSFSLANTTNSVIKPLIVVPQRGLVGTGLIWPIIGGRTVLSISTASEAKPEVVFGRPGVYRLSVEPGQTSTYVVEISGNWPPRLGLWNERVYEFHIQNRALFRGLLLGIASLIALYLALLYFVSRQPMYLSAALFSIASTILLLSEFGYFSHEFFSSPSMGERVRAAIESLMALGIFSFLHTYLSLRQRLPFLGYMNLMLILWMIALVAYSFYQPEYAAGLARINFTGGVGLGAALILYLTAHGNTKAHAILPAWAILVGWTVFTGSAVQGLINHPLLSPVIAAGLILVLLLIAFVVTQFALGKQLAGESTGRKSLALTGAAHSVWDYNLEQKAFYVSPEIESLLGLRRGHFELGGTHTWLDLMHKEDRANYTDKLDAIVRDGTGRINLAFRMRGTDGHYRWLQLRARAMPGETNQAARCIGILADITQTKVAEDRLLRDAVHDHLTGLPNQTLFADRLERALNRHSLENDYEIGLILVDIDRFNNINDSLGHAAGESFILISARRIATQIARRDTVARVSENRFAILVTTHVGVDEIYRIAENIQNAISEPIPFKPKNIYLTTNVGIAIYKSEKDDAAEFQKQAEIAMYSAKRHGGNNISIYDPRMARRSTNRVALESDLRRAIEYNEFKLLYQPIVHLDSGKIAGFEALIRWQHPERGLLEPSEFMDIAEETGLIIDIGHFVLNEASLQLGSWQRLFTSQKSLFMSVNVSTRQIIQPDMVNDLQAVLERSEITPGTLKIEVTETQVMENPELASRVLKRIKRFGAGLSLDDFGTGYSSLSYLQSFPFDTIKIDKSFVHNPDGDASNVIILKAVVSLAHDLGMQVVAEGAERIEEAALLNEIGCEFVQGFLFGEPMEAKDAQKLLSHRPLSAEETATETIFTRLSKLRPGAQFLQPNDEVGAELGSPRQTPSLAPEYDSDETYEEVYDDDEFVDGEYIETDEEELEEEEFIEGEEEEEFVEEEEEEEIIEEVFVEEPVVEPVEERAVKDIIDEHIVEEVVVEEIVEEVAAEEVAEAAREEKTEAVAPEKPVGKVVTVEIVEEENFIDENILDGYITDEAIIKPAAVSKPAVQKPMVKEIIASTTVDKSISAAQAPEKTEERKTEEKKPAKQTVAHNRRKDDAAKPADGEGEPKKAPRHKPAATKVGKAQARNQSKKPNRRKKKKSKRNPGKKKA